MSRDAANLGLRRATFDTDALCALAAALLLLIVPRRAREGSDL